jgi:uncharacterized protein YecT (DUF1311 family)
MRPSSLALVSALAVFFAAPAFANYSPKEIEDGLEQCQKEPPGPQVEINGCADLRAAKAELRLTNAYSTLHALLKKVGEPGDVAHLLKVQRAWIAFREASCESDDRGSMVALLYSGCMESMADNRAAALETWLLAVCERSCGPGSDVKECKPCGT